MFFDGCSCYGKSVEGIWDAEEKLINGTLLMQHANGTVQTSPLPATSVTGQPANATVQPDSNLPAPAPVGNATVHLTCKRYPEPPAHFMANPDVEVIFMRWRRFREGHEPLQSMAYFVVTFLERIAGSRSNASAMFSISSKVIRTMARLATERGAPSSARKAPTTNTFVELTARERRWLETAVRTIIEHLGEHSTPGAAKQLQMSDLPAL